MATKFWRTDENAPFATLLRVADGYCHPEAGEDAYDELVRNASDESNEILRKFKAELREALKDPAKLPPGALGRAAEYDDGTDEAFLRRLWRDLYGDEPV
jgi:hypothetical protein